MKIGTSLYDLTLVDAQEEVKICLLKVEVRLCQREDYCSP